MDKNIAERKRKRQLYLNTLITGFCLLLCELSFGQATEYTISTVAGTGIVGFSGDGGLATYSQIAYPTYAVVNSKGDNNLYIADAHNNVIRMVTAGGVIKTVVGTYNGTNFPKPGIAYGGYSGDGGLATHAQLNFPFQIAFDSSNNLYFVDRDNNRIRKVGTNRIITTIAGDGSCLLPDGNGDGGHPLNASICWPFGLRFWGNDLYVTENSAQRIRRIASYNSANPIINTVAGTGTWGDAADDGLAVKAEITRARAIAFDSKGNWYFADTNNNRIRKVDVYGYISTYVGTGIADYAGDGTNDLTTKVHLNFPRGVLIDPQDNLYISDSLNRRIRKVDTQGYITTIAGNGQEADRGDGGLATQASFIGPMGISMDEQGNIYVADKEGNKIRKLTPKDNSVPSPNSPPIADGLIECASSNPCVSGQAPLKIYLDARKSHDTDGDITQYQWQDSFEPLSKTGKLASLVLNLAGEHTITLTVTDDKGATASKDFFVTVSANTPPVAQFTVDPPQGTAPLTVTVDASQSYDSDGDTIKSYSWEYYDSSNPSIITPKKTLDNYTQLDFQTPGTYCITLVVEDDKGNTSPKSNPQCIQADDPPEVSLIPKEIPDASLCGDFDVTIQIQASQGQEVSSAQVYLNFDPKVLQVKSGGIKTHDELEDIVGSTFNNTTGKVILLASTNKSVKPTGTFDLVTITFTANQSVANTILSFDQVNTKVLSPAGLLIFSHKDPILFEVKDAGLLKGQIVFQPDYVSKVVNLRIHVDDNPQTYQVQTNNNGVFKIELPPGNHKVYVAKTNSIQLMKTVTLKSGVCNPSKLVTFKKLYAGDVVGTLLSPTDIKPTPTDNFIGVEDLNALKQFAQGNLLYENVDYNLDGILTEDDWSDNFLRHEHFDLNNDGDFDENDIALFQDSLDAQSNGQITPVNKPSGPYVKSAKNQRSHFQPLDIIAIDELAINDSFEVAIEMEIDDIQPVFAAEAHLNFDPHLLRVNQIKVGDHFDSTLGNHFDNENGEIHFVAAQTNGEAPTGSFILMTINCTLLGMGGDQSFTIDTSRTKAIFNLRPVLRQMKAFITAIYAAPRPPSNLPPLAVGLLNFTAEPNEEGVILTWQTATEKDNAGFNILRSEQRMNGYVQLNSSLIPTRANHNEGATYSFVDNTIVKGKVYYYQLQDISFSENRILHGPVSFIAIRSPKDNAFFTSATIPTFAWTHDSPSLFSIKYYYGDEPQKIYAIPVNGTTLTPTTETWQTFAEKAKGQTVFWRIVGNNTVSETRRFIVTD